VAIVPTERTEATKTYMKFKLEYPKTEVRVYFDATVAVRAMAKQGEDL